MKWGVRRSDAQLSRARGRSKVTDDRGNPLSKEDAKWEKNVAKTRKGLKAFDETAAKMNSTHIPRINAKWDKVDLTKAPAATVKKYEREVFAAFEKEYSASLKKAFGESPSGKYKVVPVKDNFGPAWTVSYTDVKHGDDHVLIRVKKNAKGHIIELKVEGTLEHAAFDAYIEHYGIKGMRWGIRRSDKELARARRNTEPSEDSAQARAAQQKVKTSGVAALSNKELKALNERMNLERNFNNLISEEKARSRGPLKSGAKFAGKLLMDFGKNYISKKVSDSLTEEFDKLFRKDTSTIDKVAAKVLGVSVEELQAQKELMKKK